MQGAPSDIRERASINSRLWRLLITGGVLALTSMAPASDDWQYWSQVAVKHELTGKVTLDVASVQKWFEDSWDFFLYNVAVLPTVSLTENVSLGAGYLCERKEEDDRWMTENRLLVPLAVGWTVKPWLFQLRNQLEYRDLEYEQDRWRIRERISLKWPIHIGRLSLVPFISEEAFYDFTVGEMNQNRATAGLSVPWGKHMALSIFYMNKANRDGDWSTANVLGTDIAFKF
jgi:hypothetical protein